MLHAGACDRVDHLHVDRVLDIQVEQDVPLGPGQHLIERDHALVGQRCLCATFVAAQAQLLQIGQGQLGQLAGAIGGAVHGGVMQHHQAAIGGTPHIGFHHIGADGDAALQRRQRIFRRGLGEAMLWRGGMTPAVRNHHEAALRIGQACLDRGHACRCGARRGGHDRAQHGGEDGNRA